MPPREEEELDPITLHNSALVNMDDDPTTGFEKLNFLLQQTPCPPEVLPNLLLFYVKFEYYDLAADLLAENQHIVRQMSLVFLSHLIIFHSFCRITWKRLL
jgi:tetratricopeptide repeat protein 30